MQAPVARRTSRHLCTKGCALEVLQNRARRQSSCSGADTVSQ